ncbi:MAG: penicillin-binding protein activator, partial [Cocleimonas sp.]|nr:penicillin-binding protein activator [Cocleimonas sp.]
NTLSLNYIGGLKAATGLYQFGLLPEDEAVQVAQRMLSKGYRKIAVVVPDSGWGRRLRNSFGNTFTRGGGKAIITINYASDSGRYGDIVTALSKKKKGLDAIFLAASPSQARGIQPLLRKSLKSKPIYATSHIYSGLANQYQNVSLEDITYSEIPWILEVAHKGLPQDSKFPRLRALGMDALMVAKGLPRLKNGSALNGRTGRIKLHNDGTLHRQLKWAKFNGGSPVPLPN